jgi:hypothetical protein
MSEVDIGTLGDEDLGRPEKVKWCGDNALVLGWGGKVVVVGPGGDSLRYVSFRSWPERTILMVATIILHLLSSSVK